MAGLKVVTVVGFLCLFMKCIMCKECTNIPSQDNSHTYRYALGKGKTGGIPHLIPSDEKYWASLFPGKSNLIKAQEEIKWTMLYRKMKDNNVGGAMPFLQEVPLQNVRLDPDSHHGMAQKTNLEYLLMLDVDNLVWSFRKTAGLATPGKPYGGWEAPDVELRGHFVGHYLSGTALMWASTQNEALYKKMSAVVSVLDECQKALGTGYLSAFPDEFFDRFEAIKPVWAPYYTIHKIMAGLMDQYQFAGNKQALNMTVMMADYFYNRVQNVIKQWTIERHWQSLNEETGGMNDVLYRLYKISMDPKHLELAHLFDKPCFLGLLAMQADSLSGFHANTHVPVVIGSQMRYEITGEQLYKDIGTFFMNVVNSSHAYATGGTSVREFWSDPKRLADTLQTENEEGCVTYNLLKVSRHLFRWTREMAYADYYERALTNHILSALRGSDPGVFIYMLPLGAGVSKADSYHGWGTHFDSFWCDYGTGVESFSKLGDSIYFEEKNNTPNLYVIQFIPNTFTWDTAGLTLKQTVQPLSSMDPILRVTMEFSAMNSTNKGEMEVIFNIRVPFWTSKETATAMLNDQKLSLPSPANFLTIKKIWNSGDKVDLSFPVNLRTEVIEDDRPTFQSLQAIFFGPYLLAGMSDEGWDLQTGKASSLSEWIQPLPSSYNSQLFTFMQENRSLSYNNMNEVMMIRNPRLGTNEAAHATFRVVDSSAPDMIPKSAMDYVGKSVYLELSTSPGMIVAHHGADMKVTAVPMVDNEPSSSSIFKVQPGINGNNMSISFESMDLSNCFLYGGEVNQTVQLKCISSEKDMDFNMKVSYDATMGLKTYHPVSFIASGTNKDYLLTPLNTFMDEYYTVYFNITNSVTAA